jgi:hypothetical protein
VRRGVDDGDAGALEEPMPAGVHRLHRKVAALRAGEDTAVERDYRGLGPVPSEGIDGK